MFPSHDPVGLPSETFNFLSRESEKAPTISYSDLKKDFGSGRVSKGLIFLELVSLTKRGKNVTSTLLFDTVPNYLNVLEFDTRTNEQEKIDYISSGLGTSEFLEEAKERIPTVYDSVREVYLKLYTEISTGSFLRKNNPEILPLIRAGVLKLERVKGGNV